MRISCPLAISLATASALGADPQATPDSHWLIETNRCRVYNAGPLADASATWTGPCVDGIAKGSGTLTWLVAGKPEYTYEGPMENGRPDGDGSMTYANGDRFEGEYFQGKPDGPGTYAFSTGARYVGDFVHGFSTRAGTLTLPDGQHFKTDLVTGRFLPPKFRGQLTVSTLFVICFSDTEEFQSLTPVQLSNDWRANEKAQVTLKIRAYGGNPPTRADSNRVVSAPIPGCHMVGYFSSMDEYAIVMTRGDGDF
jgi:hypothetical protein